MTLLAAFAQLVIGLAIGWVVGRRLLRRLGPPNEFGAVEQSLAAVAGFAVFSVGLMVAHIVTGGAIFGLTGPVPLVGAVTLWLGRGELKQIPAVVGRPHAGVAVLAAALIALYLVPVLVGGPPIRTGDPPQHMGWTEQILAGEPIPVGPAPEVGRNAYPWGFHAVMAGLVRLVPGSDVTATQYALHALLIGALPLGVAAVARTVRRNAGLPAAAAATAIGGFGWVLAREPFFATSPRGARHGADLVVGSPNGLYALFPPPLPRELGLVLLAVAAGMIVRAIRTRERRAEVGAGIACGLVGLVSVPLFLTALLWAVVGSIAVDGERARRVVTVAGTAVGVFALWAGPVLADFVRFGGFVSITPRLGTEWQVTTAFASWGLLLPAAAGGLVLLASLREAGARAFFALFIATLAFLGLAVARGAFDWDLRGNATLLHQGRVWPALHLLGASLAGVALARVYEWLRDRSRALVVATTAAFFAVGSVSPALAATRMVEVLGAGRVSTGYIYSTRNFAEESFVRRAAGVLGPRDVIRVQDDELLGMWLYQYSGCRITGFEDPRLDGNDLRIRFAELAERYDERMEQGGFEADFVALPARSSLPGTRPIVGGEYRGERWVLIRNG
ncbi:MAG: hypothetical protein ACRDKB_00850 [Actinomycetota bacterium]